MLEGEFTEVRYKAEVQEAPGVDMAQVGSDRERIKRYAAVIRQAVRDGADSVRRMHGLGEELALPQDTPVEVNGIIKRPSHDRAPLASGAYLALFGGWGSYGAGASVRA